MPEQDKKELDIDQLDVTELEDEALEGVSGGLVDPITNNCPCTNNNC